MQERSAERYTISEMLKDQRSAADMAVELRASDSVIRARMTDFSMQGLGVEIDEPDGALPGMLDSTDSIFIKMSIGQRMIIAQARKAWSATVRDGDRRVLKAGFQFTVIMPDDAAALSKLALECRKGGK